METPILPPTLDFAGFCQNLASRAESVNVFDEITKEIARVRHARRSKGKRSLPPRHSCEGRYIADLMALLRVLMGGSPTTAEIRFLDDAAPLMRAIGRRFRINSDFVRKHFPFAAHYDPPTEGSKPQISFPEPAPTIDDDPDDITIGNLRGTFSDGRPFLAELWWWESFLGLTYRFSSLGIENLTMDEVRDLLFRSGQLASLKVAHADGISGLRRMIDTNNNEIWCISIHLGITDRFLFQAADGSWVSIIDTDVTASGGGQPSMNFVLSESVLASVRALLEDQAKTRPSAPSTSCK